MAQINLLTNQKIVDPKNEEYYNALRTNIQFLGKDKKFLPLYKFLKNEKDIFIIVYNGFFRSVWERNYIR